MRLLDLRGGKIITTFQQTWYFHFSSRWTIYIYIYIFEIICLEFKHKVEKTLLSLQNKGNAAPYSCHLNHLSDNLWFTNATALSFWTLNWNYSSVCFVWLKDIFCRKNLFTCVRIMIICNKKLFHNCYDITWSAYKIKDFIIFIFLNDSI